MRKSDPGKNGWASSAQNWIKRMGERGDFAREFVLDAVMIERALAGKPANALDVGCGEGRFSRMLGERGIEVTGIDPVQLFVDEARSRDAGANYVVGFGENLPFKDQQFDLVVSYLSLIDIDDIEAAIGEMARVLRPGGSLLIANLTSFTTSNGTIGWIEHGSDKVKYYPLGTYLEERTDWFEWGGLRIRNWHRPLSTYMKILLGSGLQLTYFDEPAPTGGPPERVENYRHTPFLFVMEWVKPQ